MTAPVIPRPVSASDALSHAELISLIRNGDFDLATLYTKAITATYHMETLLARIAELERVLESMKDMIENCAGVPTNPDSLPQMLLYEINTALASRAGYGAEGKDTPMAAIFKEPSEGAAGI